MKFLPPDYKRLYHDLIMTKYPERYTECKTFLSKKILSVLDVIRLNEKLFGSSANNGYDANQRHRSYDEDSIFEILEYQKKNRLNNKQLARHFKLSRNTVTKWKRLYYSVDRGYLSSGKM